MLSKTSIAFLLNPLDPVGPHASLDRVDTALTVLARHRKRPSVETSYEPLHSPNKRVKSTTSLSPHTRSKTTCTKTPPRRRIPVSPSSGSDTSSEQENPCHDAPKKPRRKRTRIRVASPCTVDGCANLAVTKGCCVRHGGGARCEFPGCEKRAKKNKRCFTHGGCAQCQHEGCTSKAKRYGFCWAHGGGKNCTVAGCDKVGGQGGLCWAHGGGSRCRVADCTRRSYQKDDYLCSYHCHHG